MSDLTPKKRAELRHLIQFRRNLEYERVSLLLDETTALLNAADERDRLLTVAPCSETHEEPFDFAYCSTHDRTFALGEHCDYAGLSEVGYLEKQAREQRVRAMRAEDELARLRVTVQRVRQACHGPHHVRNTPGSLAFGQGYRDALEAILAILDGPHE